MQLVPDNVRVVRVASPGTANSLFYKDFEPNTTERKNPPVRVSVWAISDDKSIGIADILQVCPGVPFSLKVNEIRSIKGLEVYYDPSGSSASHLSHIHCGITGLDEPTGVPHAGDLRRNRRQDVADLAVKY